MAERAVLYARVSRDDSRQDGRNLESQIQLGEAYAAKQGYTIIAQLREDDKGASGADINLPGLNEVRSMASENAFDVLIVREIDRLSRSLAKQLIIEQELKRAGVRIEYVMGEYPDTPEGNLMRHIRATVAEYEREKINERVVRGRYNKVKAGSVLVSGHPPYGYRLIQEDNKFAFEVLEPEAEIVRMIYDMYLRGKSMRKIAQHLTDLGISSYTDSHPTYRAWLGSKRRTEGSWGQGIVRHILMNETYAGVWHYGKTVGRGGTEKRPKSEQTAVPVPAIIDRDAWDAVQAMRVTNRSVRRHASGYPYLLKGRIFCEHCGHRMTARTSHVGGKVYAYYRRNAYRKELASECAWSSVYYAARTVDATVWQWLVSLLADPEQLRVGLEAYQQEKEKIVAPLKQRLRMVEEMLSAEQLKLERLIDLYLGGDFPKEIIIDRRVRLETQIKALGSEALNLRAAIDVEAISQDQVELVRQFGAEVAGELQVIGEDAELMEQVTNIVNLQVYLSSHNDEKVAIVQCGIGAESLWLSDRATCGSCRCSNRRPSPPGPGRFDPARARRR